MNTWTDSRIHRTPTELEPSGLTLADRLTIAEQLRAVEARALRAELLLLGVACAFAAALVLAAWLGLFSRYLGASL